MKNFRRACLSLVVVCCVAVATTRAGQIECPAEPPPPPPAPTQQTTNADGQFSEIVASWMSSVTSVLLSM